MEQYKFLINGEVYDEAVTTWQNVVGGALDLSRIIITGFCIIALTILAIKYFSNSPTIKSEQKSALPDYMIGIVILLGAANIIPVLVKFVAAILEQI